MMKKIYAKPELEAVEFAPVVAIAADDEISNPNPPQGPTGQQIADLSAGLEFSINANGNDEF